MSGFAPSKFQFLSSSGAPNAGGSIYVYQTGTTTPVTIYNDGALTSPASNPLTLDANGEAKFYISGTTNIRIDSYTAAAGFIETLDPVLPVGSGTGIGSLVYKSSNFSLSGSQAGLNFVATSAITITLPLTTTLTTSFSFQFNAQGGAITFAPQSADAIQKGTAGVNFTAPLGSTGMMWTDANGNWGINFYTASATVLLKTINASAAASVAFSSTFITNAYNKYVIEFDGVTTSGGGDYYLTVSTNNGSAYLSANYNWAGSYQADSGTTITGNAGTADSKIILDVNASGTGTSTTSTSHGTIKFSNPSAAQRCIFIWNMMANSGGTADQLIFGAGWNSSTTAINNIKIAPSAGTITGNFHLYGIQGT